MCGSVPFCETCPVSFSHLEVHLLEKMKFNCQVFKEEISMVHLNRQVAHLQNALQESYVKVLLTKVRSHFTVHLHYCTVSLTSSRSGPQSEIYTNLWESCMFTVRECFDC